MSSILEWANARVLPTQRRANLPDSQMVHVRKQIPKNSSKTRLASHGKVDKATARALKEDPSPQPWPMLFCAKRQSWSPKTRDGFATLLTNLIPRRKSHRKRLPRGWRPRKTTPHHSLGPCCSAQDGCAKRQSWSPKKAWLMLFCAQMRPGRRVYSGMPVCRRTWMAQTREHQKRIYILFCRNSLRFLKHSDRVLNVEGRDHMYRQLASLSMTWPQTLL